jgi:hypothetical protein
LKRAIVVLGVVVSLGCAVNWPSAPSTGTDAESLVLSETLRFSSRLGLSVRGELTERAYFPPGYTGPAAGWYLGEYGKGAKGIAYYYRPMVVEWTAKQATDAAAHETCHGLEGASHDLAHWSCSESIADATYSRPVAGGALQASCF